MLTVELEGSCFDDVLFKLKVSQRILLQFVGSCNINMEANFLPGRFHKCDDD